MFESENGLGMAGVYPQSCHSRKNGDKASNFGLPYFQRNPFVGTVVLAKKVIVKIIDAINATI